MSQDSCVCFLEDCNLTRELSQKQKKFRPAEVARDALAEVARDALAITPGGNRKFLAKTAKAIVLENINTSRIDNLHRLERLGQMSRCSAPQGASAWAKVVLSLPEEQMKFVLNAAIDVLPHNVNLHLW